METSTHNNFLPLVLHALPGPPPNSAPLLLVSPGITRSITAQWGGASRVLGSHTTSIRVITEQGTLTCLCRGLMPFALAPTPMPAVVIWEAISLAR